MSYILDALKKAEADRDPEARASLALAQHDRRRNRILAYGLIIALIANAALLLWLFLPESESLFEAPEVAPTDSRMPANARSAAPATSATVPAPSPAPRPQQAPAVTTPQPAPAADPIPFSSLSAAQRQRFPRLEFSTHIYADDSDLRAVVVNGVRLQEGDRLENVRLDEITEEGAVFSFENQLISVSVLDGWN